MAALYLLLGAMLRTSAASGAGQISQQYATFATAYKANDVRTILGILSADYHLIAQDGTITEFSQYELTLDRRQKENEQVGIYKVEILGLLASRTGAIVYTKETSSPVLDLAALHIHFYKDVWSNLFGVWRLDSTRTIKHG
jgi:hypothetical protein